MAGKRGTIRRASGSPRVRAARDAKAGKLRAAERFVTKGDAFLPVIKLATPKPKDPANGKKKPKSD